MSIETTAVSATEKRGPDLSEKLCFPVSWGLVYCIWCAPKEWSADEISDDVTDRDPPGTSANRWVVTSDESCAAHEGWNSPTNRRPCPDDDSRVHILMNC